MKTQKRVCVFLGSRANYGKLTIGAVALAKRDAGDLQDMSTLNVMESCSKWARKITSTTRIPEYVSMAYRHAMDSSPGPVYLEIPTDLLFAKVEEEKVWFPTNYRTDAIPYGDPALVDAAAELLANAERHWWTMAPGSASGITRRRSQSSRSSWGCPLEFPGTHVAGCSVTNRRTRS